MTNNQKRQQVFKQMYTLSVLNMIFLLALDNWEDVPSLQETRAYIDHQNATLARQARLSKEEQEAIIAACQKRVEAELSARSEKALESE